MLLQSPKLFNMDKTSPSIDCKASNWTYDAAGTHDTCWMNAGPASQTVIQHRSNSGFMSHNYELDRICKFGKYV